MIDSGFDQPFSNERLDDLYRLFTRKERLEQWVEQVHSEDGAFDLKRGEFYPELLRGILTLKETAASAYGINTSQVHPNFGSNGSIDTILTSVALSKELQPKRTVITAGPTYFRVDNSCSARGLTLKKIPVDTETWQVNPTALINACQTENPSVLFLISPNNPTGMAIPPRDLHTIISTVPEQTLIVLDRTLVDIDDSIQTSRLLGEFAHRNLIVLHSLSKYCGYSHLRIGLTLFSNAPLAGVIAPFLPLGISLEGAIVASHNLKNGELTPSNEIINNIRFSREQLSQFCDATDEFSITDFQGNYCLLLHPEHHSSRITSHLATAGLITMGGHTFPMPIDFVTRVHTAGPTHLIQELIIELEKFCQ